MSKLKAPFPYFGGKSTISEEIWGRFDYVHVRSYIEPFAGSAAVSLRHPNPSLLSLEILNDFDGMVTNAWRAIKWYPDDVAEVAAWPMNELDLHSRSEYVEAKRSELESRLHGEDLTDILRRDPKYCDVEIAAWWIWGMCSAIGDSFTEQKKSIPSVLSPRGVLSQSYGPDTLKVLSKRLLKTRITCGDWKRVVKENILLHRTPVAVFLDPPYASTDRHDTYKHESYSVASEVEEWCKEWGDHDDVQIILAGYDGDYDLPDWEKIYWKTGGGYGNITRTEGGVTQGKENSSKEVLWCNKNCSGKKKSEGLDFVIKGLSD